MTAKDLSDALNLGQVVEWRLHCMVVEAKSLLQDITSQGTSVGSTFEELRTGKYAEFFSRTEKLRNSYMRLVWETKTMLMHDYEDSVIEWLKSFQNQRELDAVYDAIRHRLAMHACRVRDLEYVAAQQRIDRMSLP